MHTQPTSGGVVRPLRREFAQYIRKPAVEGPTCNVSLWTREAWEFAKLATALREAAARLGPDSEFSATFLESADRWELLAGLRGVRT